MDVDVSTPRVIPPFRNDPFNPLLLEPSSHAVEISTEQERLIREVLLLASSDTRFAQKAADALRMILGISGGQVPTVSPVITSVEPASKPVNSPSFKLKTKGTGYTSGAVIYVNGNAMPTAFISPTELNTDVSLVGVTTPITYPVNVRAVNGLVSNTMIFTVTAV